MKILITGANSYIGTSFEEYMKKFEGYKIDTLDLKSDKWSEYDFSGYATVFHVAGIAHRKRVEPILFKQVNMELAIEVAKKAKKSGVSTFVFMSSMSVYGVEESKNTITKKTQTNPTSAYGLSKLKAEQELKKLVDKSFSVVALRPPMVYGEGAPGNLEQLYKAVHKVHVFPKFKNERSFIHIDKLSEEVKNSLNIQGFQIRLIQDGNYHCTYEMIKDYARENNIKIWYPRIFNPIIKFLIGKSKVISKVFGDLKYEY